MQKPAGNIMRCHNDMCDIPLLDMTATEANIFMTICYRYQHEMWEYFHDVLMEQAVNNIALQKHVPPSEVRSYEAKDILSSLSQQDIPSVTFDFKELREIASYKKGGPKKFAEDLRKTNEKLLAISGMRLIYEKGAKRDTEQFTLFDTFKTYETAKKLQVTIDRRFAGLLFGMKATYTDNEIRQFVSLKSIYSKHLYRQLKRWSATGYWQVGLSELKRLLCISESYEFKNIRDYIIATAIKELDQFFPNLSYEYIRSNKRGDAVTGFKFVYETPDASFYKPTGLICPDCGKPLYEKVIGGKVQWCHKDGWKSDAPCRRIFHSVAEINDFDENPGKEALSSQENAKAVSYIDAMLDAVFDKGM